MGISNSKLPQHKRMAQGERVGFKSGGSTGQYRPPSKKTGLDDSPIEKVKRRNGVPGMKDGGCACGG